MTNEPWTNPGYGQAGRWYRATEVSGQIPLIAADIINCLPVAFEEAMKTTPHKRMRSR